MQLAQPCTSSRGLLLCGLLGLGLGLSTLLLLWLLHRLLLLRPGLAPGCLLRRLCPRPLLRLLSCCSRPLSYRLR